MRPIHYQVDSDVPGRQERRRGRGRSRGRSGAPTRHLPITARRSEQQDGSGGRRQEAGGRKQAPDSRACPSPTTPAGRRKAHRPNEPSHHCSAHASRPPAQALYPCTDGWQTRARGRNDGRRPPTTAKPVDVSPAETPTWQAAQPPLLVARRRRWRVSGLRAGHGNGAGRERAEGCQLDKRRIMPQMLRCKSARAAGGARH